MSDDSIGKIGWLDLTVDDAVIVKSFYRSVVGWGESPVEMGGYNDFCMIPSVRTNPLQEFATAAVQMQTFRRFGWSISQSRISPKV